MNKELVMVMAFRRALEGAAEGRGMSRALVEELRPVGSEGQGAARLLLLGHPLSDALRPLASSGQEEVAILATLVLAVKASSAITVGKNGEVLATTLERWVKAKESRILEQRVQRFRSLLTSGVLGAVTAMVASLGPLIANLSLVGPAPPDGGFLLPAAALMSGLGAGMLGVYMSGKHFYVNVGVSMVVFAFVSALASPLASVPSVSVWGVK